MKLRYGDVALMLTQDELGRTRFAVRPTFRYFKGGNRRLQQFVCPRLRKCCRSLTRSDTVRPSPGSTKPTCLLVLLRTL